MKLSVHQKRGPDGWYAQLAGRLRRIAVLDTVWKNKSQKKSYGRADGEASSRLISASASAGDPILR